jgi:probable rRNA maturation factor
MINFNFEQVEIPDFDNARVTKWIKKIAAGYGKHVGMINYVFCDDSKILSINKQFLNHDYYTDIITFDYSEGNKIAGDIYISLDTVYSNATELNIDYVQEIDRIIIHGVLHLCGQADKTPAERAAMTAKENLALEKR